MEGAVNEGAAVDPNDDVSEREEVEMSGSGSERKGGKSARASFSTKSLPTASTSASRAPARTLIPASDTDADDDKEDPDVMEDDDDGEMDIIDDAEDREFAEEDRVERPTETEEDNSD